MKLRRRAPLAFLTLLLAALSGNVPAGAAPRPAPGVSKPKPPAERSDSLPSVNEVAAPRTPRSRGPSTLDPQLQQASERIGEDVYNVLGTKNAVAALTSYGSGGHESVNQQLQVWKQRLV